MPSVNKLSPIPHPPKKPVVGNMLSLDTTAPVQHLARLAKDLGPIFWLDMMGAPLVIVSGHELVDELSDEKRFDKAVRGSLRRERRGGGGGGLSPDPNQPEWRKGPKNPSSPVGNPPRATRHPSTPGIAQHLVEKK